MPRPGFHQRMGGRQKHKNLDLKGGWHRLEVTDAVRRGSSPSPAREHRRAVGAGDGEEGIVSKILLLFSVAVSFQNTPFFSEKSFALLSLLAEKHCKVMEAGRRQPLLRKQEVIKQSVCLGRCFLGRGSGQQAQALH